MKKITIFAILCTFVLMMTSCQDDSRRRHKHNEDEDSVAAESYEADDEGEVYDDEAFDVDMDDVIDPDDEEADETYGGTYEEEEVYVEPEPAQPEPKVQPEKPVAPEKPAQPKKEEKTQKQEKQPKQEPAPKQEKQQKSTATNNSNSGSKTLSASQINKLMDSYDAACFKLQRILSTEIPNTREMENCLSQILNISLQLDAQARAGNMTVQQLHRYQKQEESYNMMTNNYMKSIK